MKIKYTKDEVKALGEVIIAFCDYQSKSPSIYLAQLTLIDFYRKLRRIHEDMSLSHRKDATIKINSKVNAALIIASKIPIELDIYEKALMTRLFMICNSLN